MTNIPSQLTVDRAIDEAGLPVPSLYSPAAINQLMAAIRGGDKITDSLGNVSFGLEVMAFFPRNPAGNGLTIPTGTGAGTQTLTLASAANQELCITGLEIQSDLAVSGSTTLLFTTGGMSSFGPRAFFGTVSTALQIEKVRLFPVPIRCGVNTAATISVTLPATTNYNLRLSLYGFLRDV